MAECDFAAVTNIPSKFHASDLRAHFSSLVESNSFVCFHFRHRPEKVGGSTTDNKPNDLKRCCVVKVVKTKLPHLLRYNGEHWTDVNGDFVVDVCHISQIKLKSSLGVNDDLEAVEEAKLLQMPELNPPELMPNGNVGTRTLVFLDLIQQCLLPHNLIDKLQLKFSKTAARRIYANVNFDYGTSDSHESAGCIDATVSQLKYPGDTILTAKPHFKYKAPFKSDEQKGRESLINKTSHHTNAQEAGIGLLVMNTNTDSSSLHLESASDSSSTDLEKLRPVQVVRDTNLEHSDSSSVLATTSSSDQGTSLTVLTPMLSKNRSSKSVTVADKFLVPEAVPFKEASQKLTNKERKRIKKEEQLRIKKLKAENIEEKLIAVEKRYHNDDDAEEWDRHEASEDDPSNQERNKERLYEEEIEQPWEKGGPGVVFYTDAVYWQEKEGDFDEQTTDDLDVDFSAYEEEGAGDKDIKDFLRIRQERRFRDGSDDTDRFSIGIGKRLQGSRSSCSSDRSRIGVFECHSKGIGRKVMERQGWKEGRGLGRSVSGIVKALKGEGQTAHNKKGLGYTDVKPVTYGWSIPKTTRSQPHLITSVYDDPKTTDPKEPLLQRSEPTTLKHRQSHVQRFS